MAEDTGKTERFVARPITFTELERFQGLITHELVEMFWSRTAVISGGCWLFPFNRVRFHDIITTPKRVIYALTGGTIPHEKKVINICSQPRCINPYHLALDDIHRGLSRAQRRAKYEAIQANNAVSS